VFQDKAGRVGRSALQSRLYFLFLQNSQIGLFADLAQTPVFTQGKSRHCGLDPQELTYATPYQVRGDILKI